MATPQVVDTLLASAEPSVRFLTRRDVLGEDSMSPALRREQDNVVRSALVAALLAGHARRARGTYAKWHGAHWVALALAELGHPGGGERISALVDEVLDHWTAPRYLRDVEATDRSLPRDAVPIIAGKARRCGSQHGAALLVAARLGDPGDERADLIARRLGAWQWPDGGWNCDRRPDARTSSVNETLLPLRGLAAIEGRRPGPMVRAARAFFLERNVAFSRTTGEPITADVMRLHHPVYWHFDILAGLWALAESGGLRDGRCQRALDYLESRRHADGMWGADARYYRVSETGSNVELVDWGPAGRSRPNPWITVRALAVLRAADRL
ncbi:MAG TPA: hypothetical protein VF365_07565 [Candidatus Limnocylindria bacterium]